MKYNKQGQVLCEGTCGKYVNEVCRDGFCRDCHKSISWEDCMNRGYDPLGQYPHTIPYNGSHFFERE